MSPEMNDGYYRIVLTWGLDPWDLDSHLVANTDTGNGIHVYFESMNPNPHYANLDVDDIDSYGSETITITNFDGLSNIRYAVHDYTNRDRPTSTALANSGAVVRLYKGSQLLRTFNVPTGYGGTEWDVFTLNSSGRITVINTMTYANNPESVLSGARTVSASGDTQILKDYELAEAAESTIETGELGADDATEPVETGNERSENSEPVVEESIVINDSDFIDAAAYRQ